MAQANLNFNDLMQAGRVSLSAGRRKEAHDLWKQAAALEPYNEQVWLSLLDAVDDDEDKRVCLQNILQINSMNVQARRELNRLEAKIERVVLQTQEIERAQQGERKRQRSVLLRAMMLGIAVGLSGVVFGIVISILLYNR